MIRCVESSDGLSFFVQGWDPHGGDDDVVLGAIKPGEDGRYWFHPTPGIALCFSQLTWLLWTLNDMNHKKI